MQVTQKKSSDVLFSRLQFSLSYLPLRPAVFRIGFVFRQCLSSNVLKCLTVNRERHHDLTIPDI